MAQTSHVCSYCGHATPHRYHPYWMCVLYRAGVDPYQYPDLAETIGRGERRAFGGGDEKGGLIGEMCEALEAAQEALLSAFVPDLRESDQCTAALKKIEAALRKARGEVTPS